jgi:hypothetical protein
VSSKPGAGQSDNRAAGARPLRGPKVLQKEYARFRAEVVALLKGRRLDPLSQLTHRDYVFAIADWLEKTV